MIPNYIIQKWKKKAPWKYDYYVEQDMIISRALVELYKQTEVSRNLAFRGGTALNKLIFQPAARYSEDLDFVIINDAPIGETLSAIREALDPWLGKARWKQTHRSAKLYYRFESEEVASRSMRLKIEINTVECFTVYGFQEYDFSMESDWFTGNAKIVSYTLEELMATKLRALYQRLKGRDLYDVSLGISQKNMSCQDVIKAFNDYNKFNNTQITRAQFEENLFYKKNDKIFQSDIKALLSPTTTWNVHDASELVLDNLISKLPGKAWEREVEIA